MILGFITMFFYILTASKFITKRLGNKKLDDCFGKLHKIFAGGLIVCAVIHMILALRLFYQRPVAMTVIGFILLLAIIVNVLNHMFAKQLKRKWIVIHRIATLVILLCLLLHIFLGFFSLNSYKQKVNVIEVMNMSADDIADGYYIGTYDVGYISAKVGVTIKSNKIISIDLLEHRTEKGQKAEMITAQIVKQQQTKVDAVSGATNSSKVIMKAVENALLEADK